MLKKIKTYIFLYKYEIIFLSVIYALGLYFRLAPRLQTDPHLLTLNADIWERLAIAQYFKDHGFLPEFCLRYIAYGHVPLWYPPISPILFAWLSWIFRFDIPTVSSRIIPFIEALSPLTIFFLSSMLFNKRTAFLATVFLALTPSFNYWSGISDPQSLTLFLMPVYIMLLVWRGRREGMSQKKRIVFIFSFGCLLAANFLTHLTYFLVVPLLLLVAVVLVLEKKAPWLIFDDLISAIIASQLLTAWWWLPKNLYWWWVKALVTSSGLYTTVQHLQEYGFMMAIFELCCCLALLAVTIIFPKKRKAYVLLLFLWALIPFLETQNEPILKLIHRYDLTWSTLCKPLEGFRFYCFLAQPLAIISAVVISEYAGRLFKHGKKKIIGIMLVFVLVASFVYDIHKPYNWFVKIQNAGITKEEYNAALWFRENSLSTDRVVADYYRVQMCAGVCGGKALLGGLFPLRNVDFPFIKMPAVVQDDIYTMYMTDKPEEACQLMKRYGATHIFYSENMIQYGALGSKHKEGFGVDINKEKFKDGRFFEEAYNYNDDVMIIKVK